jgi:hypothetical protein
MKRDQTLKQQRQRYIQARLNKAPCTSKEIKKISAELFISERTVYLDFATTDKNIDKH